MTNPRESNDPLGVRGSRALTPETFGSALGQAVWLMTMSAAHRDVPIKMLETNVLPALLLKQFKLYFKGKQPVAFVTWAMVTDAVQERFEAGEPPQVTDWRGGTNLIVVECVSPFADAAKVKLEFLRSMKPSAAE